ncbi:MAG: NnrS family protein [Deltaproteobacteria bacterium]|nr:MAG: NnrS family protein [Deltaproteobacteria bacterium]TMB36519.1 MAG: NnrS family protein [Deltaproteobacteria bacterium]
MTELSLALASSVGNAPLWRREPYRLLFPLGIVLSWTGVLPWLLFAIGVTDEYRSIFHSMAQVQGFLACFAVGFLFTMIPRRTGTAAPSPWQMAVVIAAPIATTACAWLERWALAQVFWLSLLALIAAFALRRFRPGDIPDSFVWVFAALASGMAGAVLAGYGAATEAMWLHDVGRGLVLQGTMSALVIGVGGFLLPAITRGEPPARPSRRRKLLHVAGIALFVASFFVEGEWLRLGFVLRAGVPALALIVAARLWRKPSLPGLHRRLVWIAAWMLPAGYAFVGALPGYRRVGLHVVFIGCFALMVLTVSVHVVLSHAGAGDLLRRSGWQLRTVAVLLFAALFSRMMVDFDMAHVRLWLGIAAGTFLASTLVWLQLSFRRHLQP